MEVIFWSCWVLAGIANSFTDWYGFQHVNDGWKYKYRLPLEEAPNTLYYRLTGLRYKERFFLSGTLLIFLTDFFHLFQLIQIALIISCIGSAITEHLQNNWTNATLIPVVWGITTHVSYIVISKTLR